MVEENKQLYYHRINLDQCDSLDTIPLTSIRARLFAARGVVASYSIEGKWFDTPRSCNDEADHALRSLGGPLLVILSRTAHPTRPRAVQCSLGELSVGSRRLR